MGFYVSLCTKPAFVARKFRKFAEIRAKDVGADNLRVGGDAGDGEGAPVAGALRSLGSRYLAVKGVDSDVVRTFDVSP
jgi:hypothetical protein